MTDESFATLTAFREQLSGDVMFCTTRDQHIRQVQRIAELDRILASMQQEQLPETV